MFFQTNYKNLLEKDKMNEKSFHYPAFRNRNFSYIKQFPKKLFLYLHSTFLFAYHPEWIFMNFKLMDKVLGCTNFSREKVFEHNLAFFANSFWNFQPFWNNGQILYLNLDLKNYIEHIRQFYKLWMNIIINKIKY